MSLPICTYGNPVLRQKAIEVMNVDDDIRAMVKEMLDTMYKEKGVGLAAEQIGRTERIFVVDIPSESDLNEEGQRDNPGVEMPIAFINPQITDHGEEIQVGQEGCLSFPGIYATVERWNEVDCQYTDLNGIPQTLHAKGLLARAIQHELDHLNGVLFVDLISQVKKVTLGNKLKRLAKETKKALK